MVQSEQELHSPCADVLETSNFIHITCSKQDIIEINDVLRLSEELRSVLLA